MSFTSFMRELFASDLIKENEALKSTNKSLNSSLAIEKAEKKKYKNLYEVKATKYTELESKSVNSEWKIKLIDRAINQDYETNKNTVYPFQYINKRTNDVEFFNTKDECPITASQHRWLMELYSDTFKGVSKRPLDTEWFKVNGYPVCWNYLDGFKEDK